MWSTFNCQRNFCLFAIICLCRYGHFALFQCLHLSACADGGHLFVTGLVSYLSCTACRQFCCQLQCLFSPSATFFFAESLIHFGAFLTVILHLAFLPFAVVTVMVAFPTFLAVIFPLELTTATFVLLLVQVSFLLLHLPVSELLLTGTSLLHPVFFGCVHLYRSCCHGLVIIFLYQSVHRAVQLCK